MVRICEGVGNRIGTQFPIWIERVGASGYTFRGQGRGNNGFKVIALDAIERR